MIRVKSPARILLVALALGWSVDLLFYGKALGISALLFVLLLMVALFGLGWLDGVRPVWRNLWLLAPLFFFASMVFVRANPFVTFLNVVSSLALLGLIAHFYAAGHPQRLGLVGYPIVLLHTAGNALVRPAPLVSASVDLDAARQRGGRNLLPVIRGLLLALPVLVIFTLLLASADLVFADYLEDLFSLDILPDLLEWLWRGIIVLGSAWLLAGGLAYALGRSQASDDQGALEKALGSLAQVVRLGFVEVATVLIAVDLLFLVFVWIQFTYLFGGRANITVEGYTYAEYARRGFFELVAVSVLTLGLILGLRWLARRETGRQARIFNGLSSLMVGLVLVILASAFQRLRLYEAAYGYTQLRLYSHVFMVWLAVAFVWFLVTLWRWPDRFAIGAFVAALGFLVTLNAINPDAFIARQNLARYQATGKLDAYYLTRLSEDAVPALVQAVGQVTGDEREVLMDHLRYRLESMEASARWRSWPSFHLARRRAYDLLAGS
ncbi:MAG: DUF4173 domain-containing protein [Chloroflexi bacterium]|nr:DUF4173 domain-containing protein [Chloroflexota bacterium]